MERLVVRCFVCFLFLQISTVQAKYFFVVAPNVFRFGHEEEVVIGVLNAQGPETVYFHLEIASNTGTVRTPEISTLVPLNSPVSQTVAVLPEHIQYDTEGDKPRSVTLVSRSNFAPEQRADVLLSYESGYIFIQTDKPIYYPRDNVQIRILAIDEDFGQLDRTTAILDVLDPSGLLMRRVKHTFSTRQSPFLQIDFDMMNNPPVGTWAVNVRFAGEYETYKNTTFEVQEYRLPTFGVTVGLNEGYILPEQESITVFVNALYVYGKEVNGKATIDLYLQSDTDGEDDQFIIRGSKVLQAGHMYFIFELEDVETHLGDLWFPEQKRLLIKATVTEEATGNQEVGIHSSTIFSHTPYSVSFPKSRLYYHPSLPYYLQMTVRYVNGSIASGILVTANCEACGGIQKDKRTENNGEVIISFETGPNSDEKVFKVEIDDVFLASLTVRPYQSPNLNRLLIEKDTDRNSLDFKLTSNGNPEKDTEMISIITSRGRPILMDQNKNLLELRQNDLVKANPSARIVAFYVDKYNNEVVADSLKIHLENKCHGNVLNLNLSQAGQNVNPGTPGKLTLHGQGSIVAGLGVMDKALLLRNDKNVLRPYSLFRELDRHDLGCGQGGGIDSASVFQEAGMTVLTNANVRIPMRDNIGCPKKLRRRKRSTGCGQLDECCKKGESVADNLIIDFEDQAPEVFDVGLALKELRRKCYKSTEPLRARNTRRCIVSIYMRCTDIIDDHFEGNYQMARFLGDGDVDFEADVKAAGINLRNPRTNFEESFLFKMVEFTNTKEIDFLYPDSITEWMVSGIGFSRDNGICIAEAVNITTFKNLFIQLDLPYSAVRLEHLDVKATVFNYARNTKNVSVYMEGVTGVCSSAEPGQHTKRRLLQMPANSAETVRFPIIPLQAGQSGNENKFDVIVKAIDMSSGLGVYDYIKKSLYVKNEGILVMDRYEICLDPYGESSDCVDTPAGISSVDRRANADGVFIQIITITLTPPENTIDGTTYIKAKITGTDVMVEAVDTILNNVDVLIKKATGCGEQTMIRLAPGVYAMDFLKRTNTLTAQHEVNGNKLISEGIMHELKYRKSDGSFAVWSSRPSSTWLTAFVLKVFCQAENVVNDAVDKNTHVIPGITWLAGKQNADGRFREDFKVYHGEMIGQLTINDPSLTAFVLISMLECTHRDAAVSESASKAIAYLAALDPATLTDYQVAMITYALALSKHAERYRFKDQLYSRFKGTQGGKMIYIGRAGDANGASAGAIETTSYALLALMEFDEELQNCGRIVSWLMGQRRSGGSFKTTQATVIGLQALSQYNIKTFHREVNLDVRIGSRYNFRITSENAMMPQHQENILDSLKDRHELVVTVSGTGRGRLLLDYTYNRRPEENEICVFDVTDIVPMKATDKDVRIWKCSQQNEEVENLLVEDVPEQIINRAGRKRRQADVGDVEYCVNFNVSAKGPKDAGMSVIEFGLQTGLTVHEPDLEKMKTDKVIQSFDMPSSGEGYIILYLENITVTEPREITFRLKEKLKAENRQPSMVTVYDYYSPEKKCNTFYNVGAKKGKPVDYVCPNSQEECQCLQGICAEDYLEANPIPNPQKLHGIACVEADYALIADIIGLKANNATGQMEATASVGRVMKQGKEVLNKGDRITFHWRQVCNYPNFEVGRKYVIIAKDGITKTVNGERIYTYPLMKDAIVFERVRAVTLAGRMINIFRDLMANRKCLF